MSLVSFKSLNNPSECRNVSIKENKPLQRLKIERVGERERN